MRVVVECGLFFDPGAVIIVASLLNVKLFSPAITSKSNCFKRDINAEFGGGRSALV